MNLRTGFRPHTKLRVDLDDIIGKRFGRITVLSRAEDIYSGGKLQRRYLCRCDCGVTFITYRGCLLKGETTSCGCVRREKASENGKTAAQRKGFDPNDIIGKRFGRLTVVELAEVRRLEYHGHNYYYYRCTCECGGEKVVYRDSLKRGITRSCGCLIRDFNQSRKKNK